MDSLAPSFSLTLLHDELLKKFLLRKKATSENLDGFYRGIFLRDPFFLCFSLPSGISQKATLRCRHP